MMRMECRWEIVAAPVTTPHRDTGYRASKGVRTTPEQFVRILGRARKLSVQAELLGPGPWGLLTRLWRTRRRAETWASLYMGPYTINLGMYTVNSLIPIESYCRRKTNYINLYGIVL